MTDTEQSPYPADRAGVDTAGPSAWAGWIAFGAVILVVMGFFHVIAGFVALFKNDYFAVRPSGLVVSADYTAWGWLHLVLGVLALFAGYGLLSGQTWARVIGIGLAAVSALADFAFLPAYPVWMTMLVALDILIIYALAVHGGELRQDR